MNAAFQPTKGELSLSGAISTKSPSLPNRHRDLYAMICSVVQEIEPLALRKVDQRELLAMAGMHIGELARSQPQMNRRELKRQLESYLMQVFALDESAITGAVRLAAPQDDVRGSSILIVDDSAMARRQIQFFLDREGYQVFQAKSGEEALWLVGEVDPDLILMDISMDGISGLEACRKLKEDPANCDLPVIFLSAKAEREEILKGFDCGAIDYIVKPFHPAESLTRVNTHLRVRKLAKLRESHIQQLKHTNEAKDRVLRIASHDLRNPVGAIAGLAGFLKDGGHNLTASQREIVESIEEAGKGVVAMLNELLDIANISRGGSTGANQSIAIGDLVRNVMRLFNGEAERKHIQLQMEDATDGGVIYADRHPLRRVIDNLVSNAIKFTPIDGKVWVKVRFDAVGDLILDVEDNGPGVDAAEQHLLFKEFGKTSVKPTGGESSCGLGLSISASLVRALNGSLSFENLPEGGARFRVTIPGNPG